jgi:non-ribosomal peptide synthase protein (TIGR01720 family)
MNLEGHGRDEMSAELNLERTVGWFTNIFPAFFELTGTGEPGPDLMAVKEQARAITNRGGTYGLLRYMAPEASVRHKLGNLPRPELTFNYLGHFDQAIGAGRLFQLTTEDVGSERGPRNLRDSLFEITALILKGELRIIWIYSENLHDRETVLKLMEKFMENLQLLVDHCMALGDDSHTPSDFPDVRLNQVELNAILGD